MSTVLSHGPEIGSGSVSFRRMPANQSCPSDALKTMWIQQTASSNGSKNKREDVAEAAVHGE